MTDERLPQDTPPQWTSEDDPLLEDFPRFTEEDLESTAGVVVNEERTEPSREELESLWVGTTGQRTFGTALHKDVEDSTSDAFVDNMVQYGTFDEDADDLPDGDPPYMGIGGRIMAFFGLNPGGVERERLYNLGHAIRVAPDTAVNYVLRGEIYMDRGEYALAADDFRQALELAESELINQAEQRLGIVHQAMQDRAVAGYEAALRKIKPDRKKRDGTLFGVSEDKQNTRDLSEDI